MRAVILAVAALALPVLAAPEEFTIEPAHTFPAFSVSHLGISMQRGRFDRTKGRIFLDREAGTGAVEIEIDAASVSTGNAALDSVLRSEEFFDVARFPIVAFRARSISFEGGVPRRASGEITLRGVTRPMELSFERFACTRLPFLVRLTCGADLLATLKRSEFGMDAYLGFVGDEVRIDIQVEAVKLEPVHSPVQG